MWAALAIIGIYLVKSKVHNFTNVTVLKSGDGDSCDFKNPNNSES